MITKLISKKQVIYGVRTSLINFDSSMSSNYFKTNIKNKNVY